MANNNGMPSIALLLLEAAQAIAQGKLSWDKLGKDGDAARALLANFVNQGTTGANIGINSSAKDAEQAVKNWVATQGFSSDLAAAQKGNVTSSVQSTLNSNQHAVNQLGTGDNAAPGSGSGSGGSLTSKLNAAANGAGSSSSSSSASQRSVQDYLDAAARAGIPMDQMGQLRSLAQEAVKKQWSSSEWDFQMRQTNVYQKYSGTGVQDFLDAALTAGIPANQLDSVKALAKKASENGWTAAQFDLKLKTSPEFQKLIEQGNIGQFQTVLSNDGLGFQGNLKNLAQQAAQQGWTTDRFNAALYQTPEFHKAFPGIFNPNGSLKMNPTDYITLKKNFQAAASINGVNVNEKDLTYLFRNNVSLDEYTQRSKIEGYMIQNKALMDQYMKEVKRVTGQTMNRGDIFKVLMGEGNPQFVKVWNDAASAYSARQAGISLGRNAEGYDSLGRKLTEKIASEQTGLLNPDDLQAKYQDLAQRLQTDMPLSQIQKFGLTKQDLVELEFGGPRRQAILQKVNQIEANRKAFTDSQRATQQQGALGTRGGTPKF